MGGDLEPCDPLLRALGDRRETDYFSKVTYLMAFEPADFLLAAALFSIISSLD